MQQIDEVMKLVNENYAPLISIVIPAYNASNYLAEAIDSALAQTYPNVEIIVVNDGSRDDGATERVALSYGDKIRYFSKENGGSSSALNMGIANMSGEWFSWLSHDDLYVPQKLEKQVAYINSLRIAAAELPRHIFFSAWNHIDAVGNIIRGYDRKRAEAMEKRLESMPHNGYLIAEPMTYIFHGCSCLVHRSAITEVGCFDENLRYLNDVDFWFRFYSAGYRVHFIPEVLVSGRVHGAQVSRSIGFSYHNPEQDMYWNRCLDWLLENYPQEERLFFLFARNAYLKTRSGEGDRAFAHINSLPIGKGVLKTIYKGRAFARDFVKKVYLRLKT
jgi:glycosyltransferase involved in cell wall biosynthesis